MSVNKYVILVKNSSGDQPILTLKNNDKAQRIKQAVKEAVRLRAQSIRRTRISRDLKRV